MDHKPALKHYPDVTPENTEASIGRGSPRCLSWDSILVLKPELKQPAAHRPPSSTSPNSPTRKLKKMLQFLTLATAALLFGTANSQFRHNRRNIPGPDADGKYTISATGIRANYVAYGASISNLFINDTKGIERDIVMGWDNSSYYTIDTSHPHLGGVPGKCLRNN
jgi:hypothetical protein